MYYLVTLEINKSRVQQFIDVMPKVIESCVEAEAKLLSAVEYRTGKFNTYHHVWEIEDYNHYGKVLETFSARPDIDHVLQMLAESVSSETVVFGETAAYFPGAGAAARSFGAIS